MSPWTSDGVGPLGADDVGESGEHPLGDLVQLLARLDHVEVVVGHDPEQRVDLVEHRAVLAGHHDADVEHGGAVERADDRGQLDRLGAGAVDHHHLAAGSSPHPAGVVDDLAVEPGPVQRPEVVVVDQQHDDVGVVDRLGGALQADVRPVRERGPAARR